MTRVFLHAGFHKTGTKTIQQFLRQNADIIRPQAEFILPEQLRDITRLGFWYQDLPDPQMLDQIRGGFADFFAAFDLAPPGQPPRDLIITAENMLGRMPDGQGDWPYPVAVDLLKTMIAALNALPQPVTITVYLSIRHQEDWARSLYAHRALKIRKNGLTEAFAPFAARLDQCPLADQAARIAGALPQTDVVIRDIATLAGARFGIAQPFVDFLNLPTGQLALLQPPGHVHRSADPRLVAQLVALNASGMDGDALIRAKRDLIAGNALAGTDMRGNPK